MHFHLPKTLNGWREFAGEVGIVVVGVLIALALEQVVRSIHDRLVADQAQDAIRAELRENLLLLVEGEKSAALNERTSAEAFPVLHSAKTFAFHPKQT